MNPYSIIKVDTSAPKEFHILNLGAGVQSTALYLMSVRREFNIPWFDAAIFADTGEEPQEVYRHVEWLQSLKGPEILIRTVGSRMGDDLMAGRSGRSGTNDKGFASIPAFTLMSDSSRRPAPKPDDEDELPFDIMDESESPDKLEEFTIGKTRRQCTAEYKTSVIEKCIRQEIFGLAPREQSKGRFLAHQYLGLSAEESRRVRNNLAVFDRLTWAKAHFPLWKMGWHRGMIKDWLRDKIPHETPRSACTFCPFHDNAEWQRIKAVPADWDRACQIDDSLRNGALAAKGMRGKLYVHRSCVPLRDAVLTTDESETHELALSGVWATDCTGFCGH